ncbi:MAG TPA: CBS domain-containing protein [Nitrososphaerales archaeon]|nr:CBS domain-containing protein [Nitrososphaerales archaeon]
MLYVKDVMQTNVRTIDRKKSLTAAAKLMMKWKTGSLIVLDRGLPSGIVTEGDISRAVARGVSPGRTTLAANKKRLITIGSGSRIEEAAKLMAAEWVKKLPVVDDGKLVGIITETDIVKSSFDLVTALKEMVRARYRPPDFVP